MKRRGKRITRVEDYINPSNKGHENYIKTSKENSNTVVNDSNINTNRTKLHQR